ncbi:MAG: hypothetical protein KatS3mg043_1865 [Rhodothermaceae bacterium]|nr:MAG: hypothetical protein KatS3mg043_1865 [Rhodothermaceae bacterium]
MAEKQRPTARQIVDAVVQAMHEAREPLDEDLILVPPVFDVLLHPSAYQDLQTLFPRIKEQAKKRLDAELERLNRQQGERRLFRRLLHQVLRLFSAEHYLRRASRGRARYERAGEAWSIDIGVTAEPDAGIDYLAVETDFAAQAPPQLKGRPTVNIRRRTLVLPDGRLETVLTTERPERGAGGGARPSSRRTTRHLPVPLPVTPVNALARLTYEDDTGSHVVYMTTPRFRIGRYDARGDVDLPLHTLPDVSREHACIRHEGQQGFAIKDLSRFGVTVNGKKIPPGEKGDPEAGWHPLPPKAEIGLANAVFITFEAL